jgi:hypothetical protein
VAGLDRAQRRPQRSAEHAGLAGLAGGAVGAPEDPVGVGLADLLGADLHGQVVGLAGLCHRQLAQLGLRVLTELVRGRLVVGDHLVCLLGPAKRGRVEPEVALPDVAGTFAEHGRRDLGQQRVLLLGPQLGAQDQGAAASVAGDCPQAVNASAAAISTAIPRVPC